MSHAPSSEDTLVSDLYAFLEQHQLAYTRFDHPAVFTVEESKALSPDMEGGKTKNLFLRDKKGERHFLVTVEEDKRVDLKRLSAVTGSSKLSFGSAERLKEHLGLEPGAVSLLGLFHDPDHQVEVLIDEDLWQERFILCHPLINTSTLQLPLDSLERFFQATGHPFRLIPIPVLDAP